MNASPDRIEERWIRWRIERNRRGLRAGLVLVATLYPAFGLLDWLLAPAPALPWLWATRATVAVLALVLLRVLPSPRLDPWVERLAVVSGWLTAAGISIMTAYMGGLESPYYAGLVLVVLAAGLLFVWPPRLIWAEQAGIVLSFLLVNVALGSVGDWHVAASNLTFLSATALIAGVGQVMT